MFEARGRRELFEAIGVNRRAGCEVLLHEGRQRCGFEVGNHRHPEPPRRCAPLLDGNYHQGGAAPSQLAASSQARLRPSDPGIIDFHFTVQRLTRSIDHCASQLVQQHPRGLIPAEPQLSLEQEGRDPSLIGRHQIRCPEPNR
jgi:hypothetical protein